MSEISSKKKSQRDKAKKYLKEQEDQEVQLYLKNMEAPKNDGATQPLTSTLSDVSGGLGNTDNQPQKVNNQYIRYCFTYSLNDVKDISKECELIETELKSICKYYIFQEELSDETKYHHFQGYFELIKRMRITELKKIKLFGKTHFERAKGNKESNVNYCSKSKTKVGKTVIYDIKNVPLFTKEELGILEEKDLYDWQRSVLDIVKGKPNSRSIYWVIDKKGNNGKSALCKFLCFGYSASIVGGSKKDIICSIRGKDGKKINVSKTYIFDIPRNEGNNVDYSAIEEVKNGHVFSTKYESGSVMFPIPHIVVLANEPPETENLSSDRWKIYEIVNKKLIDRTHIYV